jgi:hypothetical protein
LNDRTQTADEYRQGGGITFLPMWATLAQKKLGCNGKRHCSPLSLDAEIQSGGALTSL